MLKLKKKLSEKLLEGITALNSESGLTVSEISEMLEYPPDAAMGDLALPCFKLSKTLRRSPVMIAETLALSLDTDLLSRVEAVNGYLNM